MSTMTPTAVHARGLSATTPPPASAYPLILDHVFSCPATYELPLRTVFAHNSNPHQGTPSNSLPVSPVDAQDSPLLASADFTSSLMSHLAQMPTQPCTLPISFIVAFLRKCFTANLKTVDFPQALTGLDYLKDLETKRRKQALEACSRLKVDRELLSNPSQLALLRKRYPHVAQWFDLLEDRERRVEALYTQLFVGLRRWILINELMITPFNPHNCFAMLNTLYPPPSAGPPATQITSRLTPEVLKNQRNGFFQWIMSVKNHQDDPRGPTHRLQPLLKQGVRADSADETGWPAVHDTLDQYIRAAQSQIDDCMDILTAEDIDDRGHKKQSPSADFDDARKKQRKADSGVSFGSDQRPSTSASGFIDCNKPLPPLQPPKSASTLEKLARELRRIKISRAATPAPAESFDSHPSKPPSSSHSRSGSQGSVQESLSGHSNNGNMSRQSSVRGRQDGSPTSPRTKGGLRKLRSLSDIRSGRSISPFRKNSVTPVPEAFDHDEMKKQRQIWEANHHH